MEKVLHGCVASILRSLPDASDGLKILFPAVQSESMSSRLYGVVFCVKHFGACDQFWEADTARAQYSLSVSHAHRLIGCIGLGSHWHAPSDRSTQWYLLQLTADCTLLWNRQWNKGTSVITIKLQISRRNSQCLKNNIHPMNPKLADLLTPVKCSMSPSHLWVGMYRPGTVSTWYHADQIIVHGSILTLKM